MDVPTTRRISAVIPVETWGALDRMRESLGHNTLAETVRHIVTKAVEENDADFMSAIRLGGSVPTVLGALGVGKTEGS